jgi:hypothetical protein
MHRSTAFLGTAGLLLLVACTRTIIVRPAPVAEPDRSGSRPPPRNYPPPPEPERPPPDRPTSITLGIPPGHLPEPGECRIWIPGTPPGRQPRPRSRPCAGIAAYAPAGSWIVYRPTNDRRLVHVRLVDERRAGWVVRVRIFDIATERLLREEEPGDEVGQRPPDNRPPPREEPPPQPPPPATPTRLSVPPGQLPDPGECRYWIPVAPARMQPSPRSRPCAAVIADAPARSWIIYRPLDDRRVVHVRVLDDRRVVIRIRIFDIETEQLLREEEPRDNVGEVDRPVRPPVVQPPPPVVDSAARDTSRRRPPPPLIQPPIQPPVERPPEQRPPPVQPPPTQPPPTQPPPTQPPPVQPPVDNRPPVERPPETSVKLEVPPGHLPEVGECRIWFPGRPPGQQPRPKSRPCAGIAAAAPAGSWIIYRPTDDRKVVHVRIVDERRGGVVVRIRIFDIETEQLLREENP